VNYKSTYQYTTCCHLLLVDHQDNSSCHLSMTPDTYIHIPETDNYWKLENKCRENAAINQSIHWSDSKSMDQYIYIHKKTRLSYIMDITPTKNRTYNTEVTLSRHTFTQITFSFNMRLTLFCLAIATQKEWMKWVWKRKKETRNKTGEVNIKLTLSWMKHHAVKTSGGTDAQLHVLLISLN